MEGQQTSGAGAVSDEDATGTKQIRIVGAQLARVVAEEGSSPEAPVDEGQGVPGVSALSGPVEAGSGGDLADGWEGATGVSEGDQGVSVPGAGEAEDGNSESSLPHWSDPPTGMVPVALAELSAELGEQLPGAELQGPSLRVHDQEWESLSIETEVLFDGMVADLEPSGALTGTSPGNGSLPVAESAGGTQPFEGTQSFEESGTVLGTGSSRRASARDGLAGTPVAPGQAQSGRNVGSAIATGTIFGGLFVLCLQFGSLATLVFFTAVVSLAAVECFATLRKKKRHPVTLIGLAGVAAALPAAYNAGSAGQVGTVAAVMAGSGILLLGARRMRRGVVDQISTTVMAVVWIGVLASFGAMLISPRVFPQRHGIAFAFGAVLAVVASDVGAYGFGSVARKLGVAHVMAPRVSPGKTWEGLAGSVALSVAVSCGVLPSIAPFTIPVAAALGAVVGIVAPIGDLFESLIKRDLGVKDMGFILPGHGGLLDRIDALLFAMPAAYVVFLLWHPGR